MSYFEFDGTRDEIGETGLQFKENRSSVEVSIFGNKVVLDCCIIGKGLARDEKPPIVLVAGFGSGWRGIAELGHYLALLDRTVALVSLPGFGNSGDLPAIFYSKKKFSVEARALAAFSAKFSKCRKAHWVGHSMGAAVITDLACSYPELVVSLTFLNPCGFEKLMSGLWLALKFVVCGAMHRLTFKGESAWKYLQKILPEEKSPFGLDRLPLRILEIQRLISGYAVKGFSNISPDIPIAYISGKKDFVVSSKKSLLLNEKYFRGRISFVRILPLWHNTTMFGSDLTANTIDEFVQSVEKHKS